MKQLTKEQHDTILAWMENRINRPFRNDFSEAFPGSDEAATELTVSVNILDSEEFKAFKASILECSSIKEVRELLADKPKEGDSTPDA